MKAKSKRNERHPTGVLQLRVYDRNRQTMLVTGLFPIARAEQEFAKLLRSYPRRDGFHIEYV